MVYSLVVSNIFVNVTIQCQVEGASQLGLSVRQVRRLQKSYRELGTEGLISKRRGKRSNNRLREELKQEALRLIKPP